MIRKLALLLVLLTVLVVPTYGQTVCREEPKHDDCPPGAVRNPPVSPLDEVYMEAAFKASFRGIFHRDPTMEDGAGKDDGCYYVRASNHFGPAGDAQCHAGWSGYWESWLQNGEGDLTLVQTPARFLPNVPTPPPPPPPPQPTDLTPLLNRLDRLEQKMQDVWGHFARSDQKTAQLEQRLKTMESKPIPISCTATVNVGARVPIACRLNFTP